MNCERDPGFLLFSVLFLILEIHYKVPINLKERTPFQSHTVINGEVNWSLVVLTILSQQFCSVQSERRL